MRRLLRRLAVPVPGVLLAFWPRTVWPCPVCVGNPNDPQSLGMNQAILFLLVVTGGVLSGLAGFFWVLVRRSRRTEDPVDHCLSELEERFHREEVMP